MEKFFDARNWFFRRLSVSALDILKDVAHFYDTHDIVCISLGTILGAVDIKVLFHGMMILIS